MEEETLKKAFEIYGTIENIVIIKNKRGKSKGYGFVEFKHKENFLKAF